MQYYAIACNNMQYHAITYIIKYCWRSVPLPCGQYKAIFFKESWTQAKMIQELQKRVLHFFKANNGSQREGSRASVMEIFQTIVFWANIQT